MECIRLAEPEGSSSKILPKDVHTLVEAMHANSSHAGLSVPPSYNEAGETGDDADHSQDEDF